jgi:glycosyltransferase involved in cell wall biosynthesis
VAKNSIAFVSTYAHPTRDRVERLLREVFPEYELEIIDVGDVFNRRAWKGLNVLWTAKEYGHELLLRRSRLRERFYHTTYRMRKIRAAMPRFIDPKRHVFSFQMQSMVDTAVAGVPHFIYTDHTHLSNLSSPYFDRRMLRPQAWRTLEKALYHNATCVFTRSTDVLTDLIRLYDVPTEKVACVYAGSNVEVVPNVRLMNDDYSNRRIVFVGQDWERKGGHDLERAFRRVLEVYPDARLTLVGPQPQLSLPNCTALGRVSLNELTRLYAEASVFCLPTRLEPFGIAFIEAMMHRLPIIGTRVGAVPDMVQPGVTGELVEPGDADELATALISLLGDPARCRRYGEAGYQRALDRYTWERVGERMRAHILSAVQPQNARATA